MVIPKTRAELSKRVHSTYLKLITKFEFMPEGAETLICRGGWSIRELLAVRVWWTQAVLLWIESGLKGTSIEIPAAGFSWTETPRLNFSIVESAKRVSCVHLQERLKRGVDSIHVLIDSLGDKELFELGVYEWAGNWPVARWISANTATQYESARKHIRKTLRESIAGNEKRNL